MDSKILNIIDISVKNDNEVLIEYAYKHPKNIKVSLELKNKNNSNNKIEYYTVDFSKEIDITKIKIVINPISEDSIEMKIKEEDKEFSTIILDNKNELIGSIDNPYIIFTSKYKLNVLKEKIIISERKPFDKIKNEMKKQIFCIKKYKKICFIRCLARKNKRFYLFNDRIMYADDNAEQLFKYINKECKAMARNSYFVLDKKSPKFKEIRKYGKVLVYGSFRHKIKYLNCRMIISSHASYFDRVYNPFSEKEMEIVKDLINKKFVFLQHGITFCDVHEMLNRPQIIADLFITTVNKECEDIKSDKYLYDEEMVVCTGFSRFDRLEDEGENIILIAPTWRAYLTGVEYGDENKQIFEESEFYKTYKNILKNKQLINKLKNSKSQLYFLLHPAFIQFKSNFEEYNNEFVKSLTTDDISYAELFKKCSVFVTDYSSIHGDVAFLEKPIIYYQFDKEKFFDSHYNKGYFDFERDGFGDVVYDEEEVIQNIIAYIDSGFKTKEEYKERIRKTFKYLDRNNSKRIYEEIQKIDNKNELNYRFNNVH